MGSHHGHMALHQRDEQDNKYRFIHIAGLGWVDRAEGTTDDNDPNVLTITSQVYVTEPKTFAGPAVYVTKTPVTTTLGVPATTMTAAQNSYESAKSVINQPKTRSHSANPTASYGANAVKGTPLSDGQISNQSHGMSAGGKAGVAIGVLAIIGLIAGLALFCIKRRKNQLNDRGEKVDEKHASKGSFFSGTAADASSGSEKRATFRSMASSHTAATAPRLSLRPMTSLLPSIMEKRKSSNNALDVPPMSEKPRSNPFGDDNQVRSVSPSADPFADGDGKSTPEVGTAAAVPITPAGAKGPNNVHRVQLDFKPSMDDELELKSGQLVRMIHEYDDGWALCMRMDRTQQGVCPRTCLSKLPVKPRPQGPPPQGGRNSPPSGFRGPPPHGANMMPRPLTPTGRERSNTARSADIVREEANRTRSQSTSGLSDRAVSPIDAGIPARKPVPGQAM